MVTERHQKQPQMRGIGSNEAASRIDTKGCCDNTSLTTPQIGRACAAEEEGGPQCHRVS